MCGQIHVPACLISERVPPLDSPYSRNRLGAHRKTPFLYWEKKSNCIPRSPISLLSYPRPLASVDLQDGTRDYGKHHKQRQNGSYVLKTAGFMCVWEKSVVYSLMSNRNWLICLQDVSMCTTGVPSHKRSSYKILYTQIQLLPA